jgi:hypothetical protein
MTYAFTCPACSREFGVRLRGASGRCLDCECGHTEPATRPVTTFPPAAAANGRVDSSQQLVDALSRL